MLNKTDEIQGTERIFVLCYFVQVPLNIQNGTAMKPLSEDR